MTTREQILADALETAYSHLEMDKLRISHSKDADIIDNAVMLEKLSAPAPVDKEAAAKAVYELFPGADQHPWVPGGNSLKQDEARRYARVALEAAQAPAVKAERPTTPGWYVVLPPDFDEPTVRAFGKDGQWWIPLGKGNGDDGWMTGREYQNWVGPIAGVDDRQPFLGEAQPPVQPMGDA